MIHWNVSPEIFDLGPLTLRWYGFLFAAGFVAAFQVLKKIFKKKNVPLAALDQLLLYIIIGTVVGARLGHCLFYEPAYYLQNPLEIFMVWKGGLASHGGAIGIILACFIYSKKEKYFDFLGSLDYVALVVPLVGSFIRMGNLMNSEIIGNPTDVPWAFIFERVDMQPRHPVQLYESFSYLLLFILIYRFYRSKKFKLPSGMIFGLSLMGIFIARFFLEFFKTAQAEFEENLILSMGQLLSIPFILIGAFFVWRAWGLLAHPNKKHAK